MEDRLNRIPGILTVKLFAHRSADILLIGNDEGVRELRI
jgi:ribose 5-phosphate isomerase